MIYTIFLNYDYVFYCFPNVFSPEYPIYRNPSTSLCSSYSSCINELELGIVPLTNKNIACSDGSFIRFLNTNINWSFDICREYDM